MGASDDRRREIDRARCAQSRLRVVHDVADVHAIVLKTLAELLQKQLRSLLFQPALFAAFRPALGTGLSTEEGAGRGE